MCVFQDSTICICANTSSGDFGIFGFPLISELVFFLPDLFYHCTCILLIWLIDICDLDHLLGAHKPLVQVHSDIPHHSPTVSGPWRADTNLHTQALRTAAHSTSRHSTYHTRSTSVIRRAATVFLLFQSIFSKWFCSLFCVCKSKFLFFVFWISWFLPFFCVLAGYDFWISLLLLHYCVWLRLWACLPL